MMRSRLALAAALSALLGLSSASIAQNPENRQQPGQGRGQRGQGANLQLANLPAETLDKLLKLTAEQKTKVKTIQDKLADDVKALRPAEGQPRDPAMAAKRREAINAANQQVEALLTADQKKALDEARQEARFLAMAGAPPAMIGVVRLTEEQKKKISDLQKENNAKLEGLQPEERRTKRRELQQDTRTKVEALLTAEQKAQIEKYLKENPQRRRNRP